jgi:hypothetical protein
MRPSVVRQVIYSDLALTRALEADSEVESEVRMKTQTKQEPAKKTVHITWTEAQRAETERENLRRARYKSTPAPSLLKLISANFSKELPRLKATALRFFSMNDH